MVVGHVTGPCCLLFHHTSSGFLFVGLFCKAPAFCSAVGKVRNQSPGEQPDGDVDKLGLSLSVCLNDTDAQVGSLEEVAPQSNQVHMLQLCCEKRTLFPSSLLYEFCTNIEIMQRFFLNLLI